MMDKDSFLNAEIPQWNGLNCNAEQSFLNSNSYIHHNSHFESAFSSMVSSPAASTAFPAAATTAMAAGPCMGANNDCSNDSCYNSTLNSSKLHLHNIDHIKMANLGNPVPLATQPSFTADPGFRVRAAKFSCSDCSFSDGTTRLGLKNSPLMGNGKFLRAFGSPSIAQTGLPVGNKNLIQAKKEMSPVNGGIDKKLSKLSGFVGNPSEESFVSERIPSGETGWKTSNEMNFRKRKEILRGKMKANGSILDKGVPGDEDANPERSNPTENCKNENGDSDNETKKQLPNQKPSKNYIHVRARRGEATDSHSLAERVRRQKISQRMKLLQDLVPGCNKVMGKAVLLDEIINYVESLQHQVKFLAMKLASVNPGLDFKNIYYLDSSAASFYGHRSHNTDVFNRKSAGDPIDAPLYHNMGVQLSYVDGLSENFPQFPDFCEDDLHSIVPMGLGQNPVIFPGS